MMMLLIRMTVLMMMMMHGDGDDDFDDDDDADMCSHLAPCNHNLSSKAVLCCQLDYLGRWRGWVSSREGVAYSEKTSDQLSLLPDGGDCGLVPWSLADGEHLSLDRRSAVHTAMASAESADQSNTASSDSGRAVSAEGHLLATNLSPRQHWRTDHRRSVWPLKMLQRVRSLLHCTLLPMQ